MQLSGYDYTAYMDYMDPMSSVPKKADKLNLSLSIDRLWPSNAIWCHGL